MITTRQLGLSVAFIAALGLSACDMDFSDPVNPPESEAIATVRGLKAVGVGLQGEWGNEVSDPIYVDALVTDQIGAISAAFEGYRNADAGLPVANSDGPSIETWSGMYDVVQVANVLLTNVPLVPMQPGTQSGLLALAKLFKAMAFGNLLNVYERIPLEVGLENLDAAFVTRQQAQAEVLKLLNEARQHILTVPVSTEFTADVIAPGFDLANTIDAMIARYSLIYGDLTGAATAAARVNRSVLSEFRFNSADPNPLWTMWFNSNNPYRMRPEDAFRVNAQPGDLRVAYWVLASTVNLPSNPASPLDDFVKYSLREHSIPAYQPDEMLLIRAEVAARQNNLDEALTLLNQVRTPCASALAEPVACLPALTAADVPTQDAMLAAILRERQYELFLQGLRWSDLRRFGLPLKYSYLMVSRSECQNNPSAPPELCALLTTN
jgi:starch-binding outer membrane protein, SusD/RagB family